MILNIIEEKSMLPKLPPGERICDMCSKPYMHDSELSGNRCKKCWEKLYKLASASGNDEKPLRDKGGTYGKSDYKNSDYFHNNPTYDFNKK